MPIVIHRECHTEMPNGRSLPMESRAKLLLLNDFGHVDKLPLPYQLSTSRRGWSPNVVIKMFSTPTLKKKKKKREHTRKTRQPSRQTSDTDFSPSNSDRPN